MSSMSFNVDDDYTITKLQHPTCRRFESVK
jgi:hypothetical protein